MEEWVELYHSFVEDERGPCGALIAIAVRQRYAMEDGSGVGSIVDLEKAILIDAHREDKRGIVCDVCHERVDWYHIENLKALRAITILARRKGEQIGYWEDKLAEG